MNKKDVPSSCAGIQLRLCGSREPGEERGWQLLRRELSLKGLKSNLETGMTAFSASHCSCGASESNGKAQCYLFPLL